MKTLAGVLALFAATPAYAAGLDEQLLDVTGISADEAHVIAGVGLGATIGVAIATQESDAHNEQARVVATLAGCFAVAAAKETYDHYQKDGWDSRDVFNTAGPSCLIGATFIAGPLSRIFVYVEPEEGGASAGVSFRF